MALFDEGLIKAACGDGKADAIRALSENIRVAIRDRAARGAAPVINGGGLGDSDAANFAYRMLRACQREAIPPPEALVDLFQILFKQDRKPQKGIDAGLLSKAQAFLDANPVAGVHKIAAHLNEGRAEGAPKVAGTTVSRWKKSGLLH
jgi:hypothetical protein